MWLRGSKCPHPPLAHPETLPYLAKAAFPNCSQNLEVVKVHWNKAKRYQVKQWKGPVPGTRPTLKKLAPA